MGEEEEEPHAAETRPSPRRRRPRRGPSFRYVAADAGARTPSDHVFARAARTDWFPIRTG